MNQSSQSFSQSAMLLIAAIAAFGMAIGAPKPLRFAVLGVAGTAAAAGAVIAHRGIRPAELEQIDKAAQLACAEAERENALEEIQIADDMERELRFHQQRLAIEAEALRRTLPDRLEMQRIENMLMPPLLINNQQMPPPPAPALQQSPVPTIAPPTQYFDWAELRDADKHPLLMILAKQGAGKTTLLRYLAKHILNAEITALDIFATNTDWQGCTVHRDYGPIVRWMAKAIDTIDRRVEQYRDGIKEFDPQLWVFEEFPDVTKTLAAQDKQHRQTSAIFMDKCSTIARKVRCRLCLVSQKMAAGGLGTVAEIRDDATIVFPGRVGVNKAMSDTQILKLGTRANANLRQQLQAALAQVQHPALIYSGGQWFPAIIPNLTPQGDPVNSQPDPRQQLENLYNQSDDDFNGFDR